MAHSKSKTRRQNEYQVQREAVDFSNRRLLGTKKFYPKSRLTDFEDRRTFHPEGAQRPARSFNAARHRLRAVWQPNVTFRPFGVPLIEATPYRVGFVNPDRVLVCVRRKIRREVMHAFAGGMGSSLGKLTKFFKKPKRSEYSSIHC